MKNPQDPLPSGRILGLDVLRGLAIFGILVVNIEQMFLPMSLANSPVAFFPDPLSAWIAWLITDAFFESKFITVFSLLFGAGFFLQWQKSIDAPKEFRRIYLRRLFGLAVFGFVHALFFYAADVLVIYALAALLMMPCRRLSARKMLWAGSILVFSMTAWGAFISGPGSNAAQKPHRQKEIVAKITEIRETGTVWLREETADGEHRTVEYSLPLPTSAAIKRLSKPDEHERAQVQYAVYSHGPIGAAIYDRAEFLLNLLVLYTPFFLLWRTLGLFLIGAAIAQAGWLQETPQDDRPRGWRPGWHRNWHRVARIGLGLGLPLTLIATGLRAMAYSAPGWRTYAGYVLHDLSSLLLAAGLSAGAFLWCRRAGHWLRTGFERVGRSALSNYIGQSVVTSILATSYGFGLFGDLSRMQLLGLSVLCFAGQMVVSAWWLKHFRIGPLEWLWRSLTYWRRAPLLRA